jgi:hypothetical protein
MTKGVIRHLKEAIPLKGNGGPKDFETSRIPHFLDSRFTDDGEIGSLKLRPRFITRNIDGTHSHFCYSLNGHQGHSAIVT